jgi:cytochrome c5
MRRLVLAFALIGCEAKRETPPAAQPSSPVATDPAAGAAAGVATGGATSPSRPKSSCGDEVLTDEGIGELRIGTTVESVKQKCNVLRDTTALGAEAMPARKLTVALSRDAVEAEIVNGRVWRIAVDSPRLRTADGLGVGTSIGRLRQLKEARLMTGEGQLFVASPEHCGMSFKLANVGPDALRGSTGRAGLARLPDTAVASEVLIFGCSLTS